MLRNLSFRCPFSRCVPFVLALGGLVTQVVGQSMDSMAGDTSSLDVQLNADSRLTVAVDGAGTVDKNETTGATLVMGAAAMVGKAAAESELYHATFADGDREGWTEVHAPLSGWAPPIFGSVAGGLTLSPGGQMPAFGYHASPRIAVPEGRSLDILWKVRSNTTSDRCPQFRLRVNESGLRHAIFMAVESTQAGIAPESTERTYRLTYHVPEGVSQIELAFDLLSFNPDDDLNATLELTDVTVLLVP